MPGWKRSSTYRPLPRDWARTVERIMRRDGRSCRWIRRDTQRPCGLPASSVDHIVPRFEGGIDADSNLQALCKFHHDRKTAEEAARAASRRREARRRRDLTRHVGIKD